MTYQPDGWTILCFTPQGDGRPYYKIFATWRWGNEEWRISSGAYDASNIEEEANILRWPQLSGSVYELPLNGQNGQTFYHGLVMDNIIKMSESEGIKCCVVAIEDVHLCKVNT